jgi:hypothetical protein
MFSQKTCTNKIVDIIKSRSELHSLDWSFGGEARKQKIGDGG